MKLTFYTIDDLRLKRGLQTEARFPTVQEALAHYQSLPNDVAKELGMTNGVRTLRLIRRAGLSPNQHFSENILVTDKLIQPPWRGAPEVASAAQKCVPALNIRFCLEKNRLVPKPTEPSEELRRYISGPPLVIRAYVVGPGWLSPDELDRRFPKEDGGFCYPLVLKYQVEIQTDESSRTIELNHWDLRRLEIRARNLAASTNT